MTQRVFKVNDPKDVKELFLELPEYVIAVKNMGENAISFTYKGCPEGEFRHFAPYIDWGNLTEIKRQKD